MFLIFYPAANKRKIMKKIPRKSNPYTMIVILCLFTFPSFGEDFFQEKPAPDFAYEEHQKWERDLQQERKRAFQGYKKEFNHYLNQKKQQLLQRLQNQNRKGSEKQQALLKEKWEAEQKTHQASQREATREYIKKRNQYREEIKKRGYSPKRTRESREFVL